jgi:cytochrome P450
MSVTSLALAPSSLPSPPGLPIFGHALAFRRDPLALLAAAAPLGPIVELRLLQRRLWLLTRADLIEPVLMTRNPALGKSSLLRVLGRLVLGDALDTLDGEAWAARIQQVAPAFKKPRLDAMVPLIQGYARDFADAAARAPGRRVDGDALIALALRLQARLLLGVELCDVGRLGRSIRSALAGWNTRLRFGLPTPDWLPVPHNLVMRRAMRPLRDVVAAAVAEARARPHGGDHVLATLATTDLDDATLTDELTTMTFLGAHQVWLALAWTLQSLAEHAHHQEHIADEATTLDPAALGFTAMVFEESLRLHPPFHLLVRDALVDTELDGRQLPRGTTLACSPWLLGRSARYFASPDEFRPERWANDLQRRLPRGAHFPFGGGPRICIANALVRREVTIVVAALVRRVRLSLVRSPRPPAPNVTLVLAPPLELALAPRSAAP